MAWQDSVSYLDAATNLWESHVGPTPTLLFYSGAMPAATTDPVGGGNTLIGSVTLIANWQNASSGGVSTLAATATMTAVATGVISFVRLRRASDSLIQGQSLVSDLAGSEAVKLSSTTITAIGQTVLITNLTRSTV